VRHSTAFLVSGLVLNALQAYREQDGDDER
jgi:hypothetical protein